MSQRKSAKPKRGRGRPSRFSRESLERACLLAAQGATDQEIADQLKVHAATIYRWQHEHPEFREAMLRGKEAADDRVERSLFHRAVGYSHPAVKIFMPAGAGEPVYAPYTEHHAPETAAASLWLRNRRPDKWRDKQEHEHSGSLTLEQLVRESIEPKPDASG